MEREKLILTPVNRIFDSVCFEYEDVNAFLIENGMFKGYFLAPLPMDLSKFVTPFKQIALNEIAKEAQGKSKRPVKIDKSKLLMFCTDPLRGYYKGFGTNDRPYDFVYCHTDPSTIGYFNTGYADWFLFNETAEDLQKLSTDEFDEILMTKLVKHFANEYYNNCAYRTECNEPLQPTDILEFLTSFYQLPEGLLKNRRAVSKLKINLHKQCAGDYTGSIASKEIKKADTTLAEINRMLNTEDKEPAAPIRTSQIIYGE